MKSADRFSNASTACLVARFAEIGVEQDKALLSERRARFKRLYNEMEEIDRELRARGPSARLGLTGLFDHENMQARLQAAKFCFALAPEDASRTLREIADSGQLPQSLDAGMTFFALEKGIFRPD